MSDADFQVSYDVLVAGGGMVGASMAVALAGLPLKVAVVEAAVPDDEAQPSFDERTTALSRSSRDILATLGIWSEVISRAAPIRRVHVSERGRFGSTVIDADEEGVDALGFVVANRELGRALWRRLRAAPNVRLLAPATASDPIVAGDGVTLSIQGRSGSHGDRIRTRLLVVADGGRSALRAQLGIGASERSYAQEAIVGTVAIRGQAEVGTAWERFTPDGPLALLPWRAGEFVFVMARHAGEAERVAALPDAEFLGLLQAEFGFRAGRFARLGKRSRYPLALVRAERLTAPRAVMLGNAAQALHPVAGQGYNLGLRDAAALAELLTVPGSPRGAVPDPGDPALLERYVEWRTRDQRNVTAFTDGLVRSFGRPALGAARGLGLLLFDILPGAKPWLARETMGLGGRRSRLARGLGS